MFRFKKSTLIQSAKGQLWKIIKGKRSYIDTTDSSYNFMKSTVIALSMMT